MGIAEKKIRAMERLAWDSYVRQVKKCFEEFEEAAESRGYKARYLPANDRRRLLNLKRYCLDIGIPFKEAAGVILDFWKKRNPYQVPGHFPRTVSTLVGRVSREVLKEYADREYPYKENQLLSRQLAQEGMLGSKVSSLGVFSYSKEAVSERQRRHDEIKKLKKYLRAFRGSPWR